MKKVNISEMLIVICISYTLLSLLNAGLALATGSDNISASNSFNMILWTSLGVTILYSHHYFQRLSPLVMVITQYAIAMGLILASIYIEGHFVPIHPDGYRDAFRSFTIPYVIGAVIYYVHIFREAKRQNILLQEIKKQKRKQ